MNRPPQALHRCNAQGCVTMVTGGYCDVHKPKFFEYAKPQGSAYSRGYDGKWAKARASFLRAHPLCVKCSKPATLVDHIKPFKGAQVLFWDSHTWQSLCAHCHAVKIREASRGGGSALSTA